MLTDDRVHPHTALVLTWYKVKRDRHSPFTRSLAESARASMGFGGGTPRLHKDFLEIRQKQVNPLRGGLRPSERPMYEEKENFL